jgi:hypothetical protein
VKAGVAVEDWKLPVFRKRLTDAGFSYTDAGEMINGTTLLHVQFAYMEALPALRLVLQEAQAECKQQGRPQP